MAELNFGLLNPPGSQSIGNAFVTGMDQAAAARAQENQNAMSQYALSKAKREDQLTNQMLAGMQGATTIEQQADVLRRGGRYKEANELLTSGLERDIKKETLAAQPGLMARTAAQTDAATAARARSRQEFEGQALRDLGVNPSDDNIRALGQDAVIKGIYTQSEADQKVAQFLAIPLANRAAQFKQYGAPAAAPEATSQEIRTMQALGYPNTPAGYAAFRDAQRPDKIPAPPSMVAEYTFAKTPDGGGFRGTFQDFVTARAAAVRPPAQPRPEAAPRTQQVTMSNGGLGIVNMDTGVITPSTMGGAPVKGKPSAFAEKTALQRTQMGKDLTFAITQLTDITKDGGLIDQSTGSGAGRLTDVAARFVGQALPGDIAIGKIAPIADLALKMVPRFEGPQSNADTKSYNEAAGQLKDSSLPTKIRKEAGKVVLRIMQARKDQFATADMAAEGAPAIGVDASNPLLK